MSVQVRKFEFKDLDEVLAMSAEFFSESPYAHLAEFEEDAAMQLIELCADGHVVLVATKGESLIGLAGAVIAPSMFNQSFKIAQELVLFIRKAHRNGTAGYRLLKKLEEHCKQRGANALELSGINGLSPDSFPGYTPHEQRFLRVL